MGQPPDPNPGPAGDPDPEPPASPIPPDPAAPPASPGPGDVPVPPRAQGAAAGPGREPREELLAGFAKGGRWDTAAPGPGLAAALAAAAGPDWRCAGASGEQLIGILGRAAVQESWTGAGKLGVIRALIRDDDPAFLCGSRHGDLPDVWEDALAHEVALALAVSAPSAGKTMRAAWELGARLPEIGALLEAGVIDAGKARLIAEVFADLSDEDAGRAEALIVAELTEPPAKTYAQVERIATAIALTIDPGLGERRRKAAEKHNARVQMFRERSGTAALSGRDLATDQALAALANVTARAAQYKDSGAFPLAQTDQLRATAYLDLLNQVPAGQRITHGLLTQQTPPAPATGTDPGPGADPETDPGAPRVGGDDCPCRECDGSCLPDDDSPDDSGPGDDHPGDDHPGNDGPDDGSPGGGGPGDDGGRGPDDTAPPASTPGNGRGEPTGHDSPSDDGASDIGRPGSAPGDGLGPEERPGDGPGDDSQPAGRDSAGPDSEALPSLPSFPSRRPAGARPILQDLIIPLVTLLGLAERPGEGHGLGPLDPDLCRTLASTAALSPHTAICLTITNHDGIAIGHGCARPERPAGRPAPPPGGPARPLVALPARINLTISAEHLGRLPSAHTGPPSRPAPPAARAPDGWALAPPGTPAIPSARAAPNPPPGDPHWCATWTLTLPDGRHLTVQLEPVPTYECDHRNESHSYQPNDKLRHLVQVRDHTCTFPTCNRHARESDFEHAVPYDKGGRTCACNAGARSRKCHRVKQAPGWKVTQPRPGWHQWTTPRGRTYAQGPKRYPV